MAIITEIKKQEFFSEIINSEKFLSNRSSNTTNLAALVMDRIRVETTIAVSFGFILTINEIIESFVGNTLTLSRDDGGDFTESGLNKGDIVTFCTRKNFDNVFNKYQLIEIVDISEDEISLDMGGITSLPDSPYSLYTVFGSTSNVSALIYDFGLIENDENFNVLNKVTQSLSSYYAAGISPNNTSKQQMDARGINKGWISGSAEVNLVGTETDIGEPTIHPFDNILVYKVSHVFLINPWFLQGQLPELEALVPPDDYEGNSSYKYVFNAEFRRVISDPNVIYSIRQENVLGSVGWFGESFNGFNSNYEIKSVKFFDAITEEEADGIIYTRRTRVEIIIENTKEDFPSTTRFIPYFSFLPNEEEYSETEETNMQDNFMYDSCFLFQSANIFKKSDFSVNDIIKTGRCNFITDRLQKIQFETEFTPDQIKRIANNRELGESRYLIAVQAGDSAESAGNSTRANELVEIGEFAEGPDIPGLAEIENFYIYPYPDTLTNGSGFTDMVSWNEDGLFATFEYIINGSPDTILNSMKFMLIAYNDTTKEFFELDSYQLELGDLLFTGITGFFQSININTTRGYELDDSDDFNKIEFNLVERLSGGAYYKAHFAQKISWQDWISNLNVNPIFLDESKPNSNRNLKSSNYSLKEGYSIRLAVFANLTGLNAQLIKGQTDYLHLSPEIDVYDYGEDADVTPEWSAVINTYRASNSEDIGELILSGEDTIMEIVWTNKNGAVASLDNIYAINRIEETDQPAYNIYELGSRVASESVKILKPITGETTLQLQLDSGKVKATCLIKGGFILADRGYNLSGKIGNSDSILPPSENEGFDYTLDTPMN